VAIGSGNDGAGDCATPVRPGKAQICHKKSFFFENGKILERDLLLARAGTQTAAILTRFSRIGGITPGQRLYRFLNLCFQSLTVFGPVQSDWKARVIGSDQSHDQNQSTNSQPARWTTIVWFRS
jgi:hypothetical protein